MSVVIFLLVPSTSLRDFQIACVYIYLSFLFFQVHFSIYSLLAEVLEKTSVLACNFLCGQCSSLFDISLHCLFIHVAFVTSHSLSEPPHCSPFEPLPLRPRHRLHLNCGRSKLLSLVATPHPISAFSFCPLETSECYTRQEELQFDLFFDNIL